MFLLLSPFQYFLLFSTPVTSLSFKVKIIAIHFWALEVFCVEPVDAFR